MSLPLCEQFPEAMKKCKTSLDWFKNVLAIVTILYHNAHLALKIPFGLAKPLAFSLCHNISLTYTSALIYKKHAVYDGKKILGTFYLCPTIGTTTTSFALCA